jgi:L-asparagine transporter-like permease
MNEIFDVVIAAIGTVLFTGLAIYTYIIDGPSALLFMLICGATAFGLILISIVSYVIDITGGKKK